MFFRRSCSIALATTVIILLGAPAFARAEVVPFQARAVRQSVSKDQAGYFVSTFRGEALGFCEFDGVSRIKCKGHHCIGPVVLDFGGGDTLEFFTDITFDTHYQLGEGTYVITGGTGLFEGALGRGYFAVDERQGGINALIIWNGTIER